MVDEKTTEKVWFESGSTSSIECLECVNWTFLCVLKANKTNFNGQLWIFHPIQTFAWTVLFGVLCPIIPWRTVKMCGKYKFNKL